MFQMHRVFCATPWELERERTRFHDLIGAFNESHCMPRGILLVPVSMINIRDKRPVQYAVEDNILECRHYLLVHNGSWGPPERNFRSDYDFALQAIGGEGSAMRSVAVLAKAGSAPAEDQLPAPRAVFSTMEEFDRQVNDVLLEWLQSMVAEQSSAPAAQ